MSYVIRGQDEPESSSEFWRFFIMAATILGVLALIAATAWVVIETITLPYSTLDSVELDPAADVDQGPPLSQGPGQPGEGP